MVAGGLGVGFRTGEGERGLGNVAVELPGRDTGGSPLDVVAAGDVVDWAGTEAVGWV